MERSPTTPEEACFEVGIKFGSLYHQFAGTPVSPDSATDLERAMESAIENQPHCERVTVDIDAAAVADRTTQGYTELTGRLLDVEIEVALEGTTVVAAMAMEEGYPLMRITGVRE